MKKTLWMKYLEYEARGGRFHSRAASCTEGTRWGNTYTAHAVADCHG